MSATAAAISIAVAAFLFWLAIKYDLCSTAAERTFNAEYPTRTPLSDEAMVEEYFQDDPIDPMILGQVRKIFGKQLGLDAGRIRPDDDFIEIEPSLDTCEIVFEVEEAFGVRFSDQELASAKVSVRSVTALVQRKLDATKAS